MLSARRRKKSKNSNYLLSLDQVDLSRKSPNFVGKVLPPPPSSCLSQPPFPSKRALLQVRANMLGTAFSVYDGGLNPEKASEGSVRHELAAVECVVLAPTPCDYYRFSVFIFACVAGMRRMCWAPKARAS